VPEYNTLGAVDLGSNSFHLAIGRVVGEQIYPLDSLKETVRLGAGLGADKRLDDDTQERALGALRQFAERLAGMPRGSVRVVGTNALRVAKNSKQFVRKAESALGFPIEVISGHEEARLIYLGVAHSLPLVEHNRLVVDIGGGSTECIIGSGFEAIERESLQVGCVASTRRFFPNGKLSRKRWKEAVTEVSAEFQQFTATYRNLGWQEALGSSGTNKAIGDICAEMKLTKGAVTDEALPHVRDRLLQAEHIDAIDLPGLSADRRPIIAGGLLVLEAAFDALGLKRMAVSKAALREGVLFDMVGRASDEDPRDASIAALMQRYGIDAAQAGRVEDTALFLFDRVAAAWQLSADDRLMLGWAARVHELGLAIAHSQYHLHGAYVLEHSDIAGFSRQDQQFLAALVRTHRRKIPKSAFSALPDRLLAGARRSAVLLRLAVLLHRTHEADAIPQLEAAADGPALALALPKRWLEARPLLRADLASEPDDIEALGVTFVVEPL